jgi:hypothetical protein
MWWIYFASYFDHSWNRHYRTIRYNANVVENEYVTFRKSNGSRYVNIHKKVWTRKPESFGFDIAFLKKYDKKDWRTGELNSDQYHCNFKHMKGDFPR